MGGLRIFATSGDPPSRAAAWLTVLEVAVLVALPLLLLRGFAQSVDLHIEDEVHYLRAGRGFVHGDFTHFKLAWSPLFALGYGLLDLVTPARWLAPDLMLGLVGVASTLALWWCARAMLSAPGAFLVAAWWAGAAVLLNQGLDAARPTVHACHLAGFLVAAGAAMRGRLRVAAALLVLLWFVRVETGLILIGMGTCLLLVPARRRAAWLFLLPGVLLLGASLQSSGIKARAWTAFRQHYAYAAWEREGAAAVPRGDDPFEQPERWVRRDFPTASSVGAALAENPTALGRHLLGSAARLPAALARLCGDSFEHLPWLRWPMLAIALALALVGAARGRDRVSSGALAWCALVSGLFVLPPAVLVLARAELMMPVVPLLVLSVGSLAVAGFRVLVPRGLGSAGRAALPLALLVLVIAGPPAFAPQPERCVHRQAVALVQRLMPDDRAYRLLAARAASYLVLAERPAEAALSMMELARSPATGPRPFAALVAATSPDFVLLNDALLAWEASYPGIRSELASPRWRATQDPAWYERGDR